MRGIARGCTNHRTNIKPQLKGLKAAKPRGNIHHKKKRKASNNPDRGIGLQHNDKKQGFNDIEKCIVDNLSKHAKNMYGLSREKINIISKIIEVSNGIKSVDDEEVEVKVQTICDLADALDSCEAIEEEKKEFDISLGAMKREIDNISVSEIEETEMLSTLESSINDLIKTKPYKLSNNVLFFLKYPKELIQRVKSADHEIIKKIRSKDFYSTVESIPDILKFEIRDLEYINSLCKSITKSISSLNNYYN